MPIVHHVACSHDAIFLLCFPVLHWVEASSGESKADGSLANLLEITRGNQGTYPECVPLCLAHAETCSQLPHGDLRDIRGTTDAGAGGRLGVLIGRGTCTKVSNFALAGGKCSCELAAGSKGGRKQTFKLADARVTVVHMGRGAISLFPRHPVTLWMSSPPIYAVSTYHSQHQPSQ
jgi:hypothetical protein